MSDYYLHDLLRLDQWEEFRLISRMLSDFALCPRPDRCTGPHTYGGKGWTWIAPLIVEEVKA